ncbi:hypothetical protein D3C87_1563510 [compost metagenome]
MWSGTKTPSATMSLEPVPAMPLKRQVSSTVTSDTGITKLRGALSGVMPDTITQSACMTPEPQGARPVMTHPPSTGSAFMVGAVAAGSSTKPRAPNRVSCALGVILAAYRL